MVLWSIDGAMEGTLALTGFCELQGQRSFLLLVIDLDHNLSPRFA